MKTITIATAGAAMLALSTLAAGAADIVVDQPAPAEPAPSRFGWLGGDYSLTLGAAFLAQPRFEGDDEYFFGVQPLVSLGRKGSVTRFSSRNDNISFALYDNYDLRAGITGKIVFPRDEDDADDLRGLHEVEWGAEVGAFAEFYPMDWLRVRGELRHGIRAHDAFVADVAVDAFTDITPTVQISGGPRMSWASSDYFETYYGVGAGEAALSGLAEYHPGGGLKSVGFGGAINWKTTDRITTSLFGEYERLLGPAADSSLVRERGSLNQFTVGVSATYRFDFSL